MKKTKTYREDMSNRKYICRCVEVVETNGKLGTTDNLVVCILPQDLDRKYIELFNDKVSDLGYSLKKIFYDVLNPITRRLTTLKMYVPENEGRVFYIVEDKGKLPMGERPIGGTLRFDYKDSSLLLQGIAKI
ncbi:MAG: hypothetical protein ACRCX2_12240 [Paraclostridium sp.]